MAYREQPLVSIVVPVHNGSLYLRESLDSILQQTYRPVEVLVLDDASTDDTPRILAEYGSDITVHRQECNLGIYDNVDRGIEMARGELTAVYHADDVYLPEMVARQVEFMGRFPRAAAVFTLDLWIDAQGKEYGRLELPPEVGGGQPLSFSVIFNALLRRRNIFLVCPTAMVRSKVYKELDGYRQNIFRNSADLDMWIRIARRHPIGILEDYLMKYRHFHASSSHRYHHLRSEPERFFKIMDHHLEAGGREVAGKDALRAYEAHRSEDQIMIAVARYIESRLVPAREALRQVRPSLLVRAREVQGGRLLLLYAGMQILCRLPRFPWVAGLFYRRWHARKGLVA